MTRYTQTEMIATLKDYFEENVPVKITEAGLSVSISKFINYPPDTEEDTCFSVYLAEGNNSVSDRRDAFIIQVQLPRVMNVDEYHSVIWPVLLEFNPVYVGHTTREATWQTWYPGEIRGGSSSFIYYEMGFSSIDDDCYLDDTSED